MTSRVSGELLRAMQVYSQQSTQPLQRKNADQSVAGNLPADRVDLSPQGKELAAAARIMRGAETASPEARKAKVEELARRIQMGQYQPPVQDIAARIAPALHALDDDYGR